MKIETIDEAWRGDVWNMLVKKDKVLDWFEKHLGIKLSPNDWRAEELFAIMSCPYRIALPHYYLRQRSSDEKYYVGLDMKIYDSDENRGRADKYFRKSFPELIEAIGAENLKEMVKKRTAEIDDGFVYDILRLEDGTVYWTDKTKKDALARAVSETKLWVGMNTCLTDEIDLSTGLAKSPCDLMKPEEIDWFDNKPWYVPKSELLMHKSETRMAFVDSPFMERIFSDRQDDEFRDFLKAI